MRAEQWEAQRDISLQLKFNGQEERTELNHKKARGFHTDMGSNVELRFDSGRSIEDRLRDGFRMAGEYT